MRERARRVLPLVLLASVATACIELPETQQSREPSVGQAESTPPTAAPTGKDAGSKAGPSGKAVDRSRQLLAEVVVTERPRPAEDYRRAEFGSAWSDVDGNGCNQRDDVLLRDVVRGTERVAPQGRCDHDVLAGTFIDPYSGRVNVMDDLKDLRQSQMVQIDHVVPLAEAWVSGARDWPAERRREFANFLPGLLAVDGPTNASKRAADPAAWRPRKGYQCAYAVRWIAVKHHWDLAVDPSEVRALQEMLDRC